MQMNDGNVSTHTRFCTGASVDAKTKHGLATSLHRAAYSGHIEVVKLLCATCTDISPLLKLSKYALFRFLNSECRVQHGAEVSAQDADAETPLHKSSTQVWQSRRLCEAEPVLH